MEAWTGTIAWAAGLGLLAGLAYGFWISRKPPHVDIALFLALGVIFTAWFVYAVYIGDPETRAARKVAFVGPFFLAFGVGIGLVKLVLGRSSS